MNNKCSHPTLSLIQMGTGLLVQLNQMSAQSLAVYMMLKTWLNLLPLLIILTLSIEDLEDDDDNEEFSEEELGTIPEDLSEYTKQGSLLFKTLWRPRHCDVATKDGDDVTMNMEYYGVREDGKHVEMEKAVAIQLKKGQAINNVKRGLIGICLGEKRRLLLKDSSLWNKYAEILPGFLDEIQTFLDVEVTGINSASWHKFASGLRMALLEPVEDDKCERTVIDGDTLSVEYQGELEDGTIFDSSTSRGAPFGPFVQGRGEIIGGYTEALYGRCLGERWRMVVPPHLAYGDHGTGDVIPPRATLIFDVRLVQLNTALWSEDLRGRPALRWEEMYRPEVCQEMAGHRDQLYIHYTATTEAGQEIGTLVDQSPPSGPFVLSSGGTRVPALDQALAGMCLGERREVLVPPRLGWASPPHHDTIRVELVLVGINQHKWKYLEPERSEL